MIGSSICNWLFYSYFLLRHTSERKMHKITKSLKNIETVTEWTKNACAPLDTYYAPDKNQRVVSIIPNYHQSWGIPHCGQKLISYTAKVNFFVFRFWLTIVRLSLARNSGIIIKSPIWLSFYFGIGFCFQCLLKLSRIVFCALFAFLALLRDFTFHRHWRVIISRFQPSKSH